MFNDSWEGCEMKHGWVVSSKDWVRTLYPLFQSDSDFLSDLGPLAWVHEMRYSKTLLQVHAHWLTPAVTQGATEVSSHGINVQKGVHFVVFLTVWETALGQCYPCIYYTIRSRQSKKADSITEKGEKALILSYVQCHKTCIIKNLLHIHTFCMFYSFWLGLKTTGLILEEKIQQNSFYQLWKSSQRRHSL